MRIIAIFVESISEATLHTFQSIGLVFSRRALARGRLLALHCVFTIDISYLETGDLQLQATYL